MTPAEVIAMRDKLSLFISSMQGAASIELADRLIESGWVTSEPERKDNE